MVLLHNYERDSKSASNANALIPLGTLMGAIPPTNTLVLYIALAVVALIAIISIAVLVIRKKRKKSVISQQTVSEKVKDTTDSEIYADTAIENNEMPLPERISAVDSEVAKVNSLAVEEAPKAVESSEISEGSENYIVIKYDKSFTAKLMQSEPDVKDIYTALKRQIMSYKGVKSRMSWKGETFKSGRTHLMRLGFRGKTLSAYFALNPSDYIESKYKVEDVSQIAKNAEVPCLYRIKSDLRLRYAKELITTVCQSNGLILSTKPDETDYAEKFPFDTTDNLLEKGLIKLLSDEEAKSGDTFKVRKSVDVSQVRLLMSDEAAADMVEVDKTYSDKTKRGIVNIDTLSEVFNSGECVDLESMKQRIPYLNKRTTYIKVLGRGVLDKPLTVIADEFSMDALKMIFLTGGKAVCKKG